MYPTVLTNVFVLAWLWKGGTRPVSSEWQYVAVRQRDGHHVLGVDLQRADGLSCPGVFRLDAELGDESVDAVRQEPGDHDKRVVLCKRRQVGDEARSCRKKHKYAVVYRCLYMHIYALMTMQKFLRDSAVFMYNDLLKAPIPAGDMAATWQTEGGGGNHSINL